MKRAKIMERLHRAAAERLICNLYMKGKAYYINCWPLLVSGEMAVWEDEPWRIRYCDITEVTFGDRYLTVFGKYAGHPEPEMVQTAMACNSNDGGNDKC